MSHTHRFQPGERVRVVVEGRLSGTSCEMPAQVSRVGRDGFICYLGPVDVNTPEQVRALRSAGPFYATGGLKRNFPKDALSTFHRQFIEPDTLDDIAEMNLEKLRARAERGMLGGSGDSR